MGIRGILKAWTGRIMAIQIIVVCALPPVVIVSGLFSLTGVGFALFLAAAGRGRLPASSGRCSLAMTDLDHAGHAHAQPPQAYAVRRLVVAPGLIQLGIDPLDRPLLRLLLRGLFRLSLRRSHWPSFRGSG